MKYLALVPVLALLLAYLLRRPAREVLRIRNFGDVRLATPEARERMRRVWEEQ